MIGSDAPGVGFFGPRRVVVYDADSYVIACRTPTYSTKLFQIRFGADGSLFVTLPYYRGVPGRLGLINIPSTLTFPANLTIGENCPVTSHDVKYSHHPSGRAHFSQTGKVLSKVGKDAVRLGAANGHIFSVMAQGLSHFKKQNPAEKATKKRGIVAFGVDGEPEAVKFVAHLYPHSECARRFHFPNDLPWMLIQSADFKGIGILLKTPYREKDESFNLLLTMAEIPRVTQDSEVFLSVLGGFDEPSHARDLARDTSFLICMYPENGNFEQLVDKFGTVDLPSTP